LRTLYEAELLKRAARTLLLDRIEERLSLGHLQNNKDTEQFKGNDDLHSHVEEEEYKFCVCMNDLFRWAQKQEISESDLECAITRANCYLRD
jgi:hypothetical protein